LKHKLVRDTLNHCLGEKMSFELETSLENGFLKIDLKILDKVADHCHKKSEINPFWKEFLLIHKKVYENKGLFKLDLDEAKIISAAIEDYCKKEGLNFDEITA
jgi:hypothetical protein